MNGTTMNGAGMSHEREPDRGPDPRVGCKGVRWGPCQHRKRRTAAAAMFQQWMPTLGAMCGMCAWGGQLGWHGRRVPSTLLQAVDEGSLVQGPHSLREARSSWHPLRKLRFITPSRLRLAPRRLVYKATSSEASRRRTLPSCAENGTIIQF